jgi:Peptidase A4 family
MKSRRIPSRRLFLEELEGRLAPSATPVLGYSTNWSGYAVQAAPNSVSSVSGTWVVPTVTGTSTGYAASWVGIDGWSSSTVEQIGTEADVVNGRAVYYAWYEMYPSNSVTISKMTIQPGDTITGQVSWAVGGAAGGTYTLTLTDTSRSNDTDTVTVKSTAAFQRSSAEWVVEAPYSGGILPLANFGKESFTAAKATINGISGPINTSWANTQLEQINMVNQRSATLDTTGAVTNSSSGVSSFVVTAAASTSSSTGGGSSHHHGGGGSGWGWGWGWFSNEQSAMSANQLAALASDLLGDTPRVPAPTGSTTATPSVAVRTSSQVTAAVLPSGLAGLAGSGGNQNSQGTDTAEPAIMPEVPADGNQPGKPADRSTPNANPDAAPMPPAALDEAAMSQACDACFTDGRWAPAAAGDGGSATDEDGASLPSIAGGLFLLTLGGSWGITQEQAAERRRRKGLR